MFFSQTRAEEKAIRKNIREKLIIQFDVHHFPAYTLDIPTPCRFFIVYYTFSKIVTSRQN